MELVSYRLDKDYEYSELEITHVQKELLKQTAAQIADGSIPLDSPRSQELVNFIKFIDEDIPKQGWEMYELAVQNGKLHEIRRYRRKI